MDLLENIDPVQTEGIEKDLPKWKIRKMKRAKRKGFFIKSLILYLVACFIYSTFKLMIWIF